MNSKELFKQAQEIFPGGVNSPVRACKSVGCDPLFIRSAKGSRLITAEGQELIDFVMSWGPMLLGHANPEVFEAICKTAEKGASFGAPCEEEVLLGKKIMEIMPHMQMIRMVNSGTEATMSALRLARGYTKKNKVIKFEGCYHGHSDCFLASAGSGVATLSIPGTPGVPQEFVDHTLLAPYNDLESVAKLFKENDDIACIIVEPIAGNMGLVNPKEGYLAGLRKLCTENKALLIFDEVITGFRAALGGATECFAVQPDLTCLGKIIGGGLPVGCYGGKKEIMQHIAPSGNVYQAGTLSGNPVAMAAGLATLNALSKCNYQKLTADTLSFANSLADILRKKSIPVTLNHSASLFTLFFKEGKVENFADAMQADHALYGKFYRAMRDKNVNLAPSGYECAFTSFAHTAEDFASILNSVESISL